jgi:hypothetical protein
MRGCGHTHVRYSSPALSLSQTKSPGQNLTGERMHRQGVTGMRAARASIQAEGSGGVKLAV